MPPHFTYDGKKLTRRRGRDHKNMWHIQGNLITRSNTMVRCSKGKLINGHNLPIMGKMHNSIECGHNNLHGINIITSKELIEISLKAKSLTQMVIGILRGSPNIH